MSNSCSNSSFINPNFFVVDPTSSSNSRLVISVPESGFSGGFTVENSTGVTGGHVIFYDVRPGSISTGKFAKAQANSAATSEVFGIVESVNSTSGIATVVMSGMMLYPEYMYNNLTEDITGASGGNDVYFLSGTTAGEIQNLAPSTQTWIAKPVLSKSYEVNGNNSIVLNYIGYEIGGAIAGEDLASPPVGSVIYIPATIATDMITSSENWVDGTKTNELSVLDYSDLYGIYKNSDGIPEYGYIEEIELSSGYNSNLSHKNKTISQGTSSSKITATINDINTSTNKYEIKKQSSQASFDSTDTFITIDKATYKAKSNGITKFFTPKYKTKNDTIIDVFGSSTGVKLVPMVKVKSTQAIYVPKKVEVEELEVSTILTATTTDTTATTSTITDVALEISKLIDDVATIKTRVIG